MPRGMEITLQYVDPELWPHPPGWTAVGLVGHLALAYDPERRPFLIGDGKPEPLDRDATNAALAPAIDAAASRLWPAGWSFAVAEVFGINRRNLQPERLARGGLPPAVLQALAHMSSHDNAEGLGWLMVALARYADTHAEQGRHFVDRLEESMEAARSAAEGLLLARRGKPLRPE